MVTDDFKSSSDMGYCLPRNMRTQGERNKKDFVICDIVVNWKSEG